MKYFKQYKESGVTIEITKEEAKHTLSGYWKEESLNDVFDNDLSFRLFTPYSDIWTKSEKGLEPMPGFYGIVG